jgi:DNA-binding FadR family transcriptional regulator
MSNMLGSLGKQLPNRFYNDNGGHNDNTMAAHRRIFAALRERDGDRSDELMRSHIMSGANEVSSLLQDHRMWAPSRR